MLRLELAAELWGVRFVCFGEARIASTGKANHEHIRI